MTWKFDLRATEDPRLFSRILQILASQMVSIRSFVGEVNDGEASVTFVVSSEEDKAYRIEALLQRAPSATEGCPQCICPVQELNNDVTSLLMLQPKNCWGPPPRRLAIKCRDRIGDTKHPTDNPDSLRRLQYLTQPVIVIAYTVSHDP